MGLDIGVCSLRVDETRNDKAPKKPDDLDEQIVLVYGLNRGCSLSFLAERCGCSKTTVWNRIQRLPEKDWSGEIGDKIAGFKFLICDVLERSLLSDDLRIASPVALELGDRLGVLPKKHRLEHSGPDGKPIQVDGRVVLLPDDGSSPKADSESLDGG